MLVLSASDHCLSRSLTFRYTKLSSLSLCDKPVMYVQRSQLKDLFSCNSRLFDRSWRNVNCVRTPEVDCVWNVMAHAQKPDFVFRRNGRVHLNRLGASVQLTTVSRGVRISGSNAGYTMFRGSVKSTGYPLHSPVSPSLPPPVRHRVPSDFNWTLHLEHLHHNFILLQNTQFNPLNA